MSKRETLLVMVRSIREGIKTSPGLSHAPFSDEGWAIIEAALAPEERAPAEPKAWMSERGLVSSFHDGEYTIPLYARDVEGKLTKPALVGNTRFGVGVGARLVVERAQREYEYQVTPEKEAERIKRGQEQIEEFRAALSPQGTPPA